MELKISEAEIKDITTEIQLISGVERTETMIEVQ